MKKIVFISLGSILFIGFLAGAYIISNSSTPSVKVANYTFDAKEKPQAKIDVKLRDLGPMKVSEQKSADFTIKNVGSKPLQFSDITSSCNCTFVQIIYQGKESELFGMHNRAQYSGEIEPQKTAVVRIIYKPFLMPVYGAIEREAYLTTNDPLLPKLTLQVKAFVK